MVTKLSTKGQLILPKEIRDRHGWSPGMNFEIEEQGDAVILRPLLGIRESTLDELEGCLKYEGPTKSLADMEAGIARGAREHS
jgi:AbrB family looped-hinge helix DNA binding protein